MNNKNYISIWLTGLSGAGKSTLAEMFIKDNPDWVLLDGDILRKGLCSDLGFSDNDRKENMRRLRALCQMFNKNGKNVITSFICPFEEDRKKAIEEIDNCFIIAIKSDLKTCEDRDVKGLYKKAPDDIKGISSTEIRDHISKGNEEWKKYVAEGTEVLLEEFINKNIIDTK